MSPEKLALKRATRETIKGVGGLEAAAGFCRVGKSVLGEYQSDNHETCFVPLDVIADLEPLARERSGWPHVTQELCRQMGGVFVEVPEVAASAAASPDKLAAMLAELSTEMNDTTGVVLRSLANGRIDGSEPTEIERELDDVIRTAVRMRALVRTVVGGAA